MAKISAVIITLNEEHYIAQSIASLQGVADEVLVVDSGSSDDTVSIAYQLGAKVIMTEWLGFAATKNKGNALANNDWILSIDADESLSVELAASIMAVKDKLQGAYKFNILNNYFGQWMRHGGQYPHARIRLFNKQNAIWTGALHEKLEFNDNTTTYHLKGDLLHHTCANVDEHLEKIRKYALVAAQALNQRGGKPSIFKMTIGTTFRFVKMYLFQLGIFDGMAGLILARNSAYAVFLREAYLWQLQKGKRQ